MLYLKQKKHKTIQYSVGGSSPVDPTGKERGNCLKYDNDTPNFDVEADKVIKHADGLNILRSGKLRFRNRQVINLVEVTVKGPSMDAIKSTGQKRY